MTITQQETGAAGAVEISPSTSNPPTEEKQNSPPTLSWAQRASRAPAAAAAAAATSAGKPSSAPPRGRPAADSKKGEAQQQQQQQQQNEQQQTTDGAAKKVPLPYLPSFARASREQPVIVLDAGALMRLENLERYRYKCTFITTEEATKEIRDAATLQRLETTFLDIHTLSPTTVDIKWAEKFADMTGDLPFLSSTDISIIALTYMLQRATGETQHLTMRPPAFEFFSETSLMQQLESNTGGRGVWTLQKTTGASHSNDTPVAAAAGAAAAAAKTGREDAGDVAAAGEDVLHAAKQREDKEVDESTLTDDYDGDDVDVDYDDEEDEDDDMDAEEGWVTEEVLRQHLNMGSTHENYNNENKQVETNEINKLNELNTSDNVNTPQDTDDKDTHDKDIDNSLSHAFKGLELRADKQEIEELVACMTTDFSMQNVLLQMGLKVLAVDGRKIRTVKIWALLCRACGHIERKTSLLFCPKCGHYTLDRTPLYFDQKTGKVFIFDGRKKISKRGQIYSIPKDKGGKHSKPIILAADQLMMGGLDRELRHKQKLFEKDVESKNPFSPNYSLEARSWHVRAFTASGKAAAPGRPKITIGLGPGNPNSNRWMKTHHRRRK